MPPWRPLRAGPFFQSTYPSHVLNLFASSCNDNPNEFKTPANFVRTPTQEGRKTRIHAWKFYHLCFQNFMQVSKVLYWTSGFGTLSNNFFVQGNDMVSYIQAEKMVVQPMEKGLDLMKMTIHSLSYFLPTREAKREGRCALIWITKVLCHITITKQGIQKNK